MMYKDISTEEVIDQESFDKLVDEEMEMWLDEYYFQCWINEHYDAHEIFAMCDTERQDVYQEFYDFMRQKAIENMGYEPVEE